MYSARIPKKVESGHSHMGKIRGKESKLGVGETWQGVQVKQNRTVYLILQQLENDGQENDGDM